MDTHTLSNYIYRNLASKMCPLTGFGLALPMGNHHACDVPNCSATYDLPSNKAQIVPFEHTLSANSQNIHICSVSVDKTRFLKYSGRCSWIKILFIVIPHDNMPFFPKKICKIRGAHYAQLQENL